VYYFYIRNDKKVYFLYKRFTKKIKTLYFEQVHDMTFNTDRHVMIMILSLKEELNKQLTDV
jgi:hypothetical protein